LSFHEQFGGKRVVTENIARTGVFNLFRVGATNKDMKVVRGTV